MVEVETLIRWVEAKPEEVEIVHGPEEVTIFLEGDYMTELPLEDWLKLAVRNPDSDPRKEMIAAVKENLLDPDPEAFKADD